MKWQDTVIPEEMRNVYGCAMPQHLAGLEWQAHKSFDTATRYTLQKLKELGYGKMKKCPHCGSSICESSKFVPLDIEATMKELGYGKYEICTYSTAQGCRLVSKLCSDNKHCKVFVPLNPDDFKEK
jgi:hypothetical protein